MHFNAVCVMYLCYVVLCPLFRALRTVSRQLISVTQSVYRRTLWSSNTRKQNRQFLCSIVSSLTSSFASCAAASCFKCIFLNRAFSRKYVCRPSRLLFMFRWESCLKLVHCIALVMCRECKLKSHVAFVTPDRVHGLIFFVFKFHLQFCYIL